MQGARINGGGLSEILVFLSGKINEIDIADFLQVGSHQSYIAELRGEVAKYCKDFF